MLTDQGQRVATHWSKLAVTVDGALAYLKGRGVAPEWAEAGDLHAIDMIHMGGVEATDRLAAMAGLTSGQRVLDVGSGVGGPARRLASRFGADVYAIELSDALHQTGEALTKLVRLSESVRHVRGSALSLPFDDAAFDVVTIQHVAMQITEKDRLFNELARVLRSHGVLALHEIFSGAGEIRYPLPWATDSSMSALESVGACSDRLSGLGFRVAPFVDESEAGRIFHNDAIAVYDLAIAEKEGAVGLSLDATRTRRRASVAMAYNLGNGSVKVGMLVAQKVS